MGDPAVLGVLTVSDRAAAGVYADESGPAVLQFFNEALESRWAGTREVADWCGGGVRG